MPVNVPIAEKLVILCLCAQWCQLCNAYQGTFAALAARYPAHRFAYLDIEDEAALLDLATSAVSLGDVVDFPTLLILDAQGLVFLGPVMPQSQTLERMVLAAESGSLPRLQPGIGTAALQILLDGIAARDLYLK